MTSTTGTSPTKAVTYLKKRPRFIGSVYPKASSARAVSFNNLVGAGQHDGWDGEAERLGGLEVDYELVGGRALHRQVAGLRALQDAAGVVADDLVHVGPARAVAREAALGHELARWEDGRQLTRGGELQDALAIVDQECIGHHGKRVEFVVRYRREGAVDAGTGLGVHDHQFHVERLGRVGHANKLL